MPPCVFSFWLLRRVRTANRQKQKPGHGCSFGGEHQITPIAGARAVVCLDPEMIDGVREEPGALGADCLGCGPCEGALNGRSNVAVIGGDAVFEDYGGGGAIRIDCAV